MATTYTLKIVLDAAEIQDLKEGKYSLCIAKKVNNKYNVVWHGTSSVFGVFDLHIYYLFHRIIL